MLRKNADCYTILILYIAVFAMHFFQLNSGPEFCTHMHGVELQHKIINWKHTVVYTIIVADA